MTKDLSPDVPTVTGDPVLINVLATAQRFAAWYAEYLSAGANTPEPAGEADDERVATERAEDLVRHLQHAVFDLMAAVHEMNRHCSGSPQAASPRQGRVLSLVRAAVH